MLRKCPAGYYPEVSDKAFIDPTAIVCGRVIIEDNVFVGPYAVIRADEVDASGEMQPVLIKQGSNLQDGVVIHSKGGAEVVVGERTSIAHRSIVHGPCTVGDDVFIGFNSVVFRCHIGDGSVIRHNAVVEGVDLPERSHVPPMKAIAHESDLAGIEKVSAEFSTFSESVVSANHVLVAGYKDLGDDL